MCKKISVIVPCYNTEKYIDRCLMSLLNQSIPLKYLSIICVDDASTDGTLQKLERWQRRYPDTITVISHSKNSRAGGARNTALSYVTTPYVGYLDSDDWVEPNMYEEMYHKAESYGCDIVFCRIQRDSSDAPIFTPPHQSPAASWLLTVDSIGERKKFIVHNTIKYSACDKLIRTEFLTEHQIEFPENLAYEDIYWGSILYLYAEKICIMEDKFYHYYVNPNATVLAVNRSYHKDILQINSLRWQMYADRNAFCDYRRELEYDFLISGYLSALKILALRFTTDTWADYQNLNRHTLTCIPDFTTNPYMNLFTEFQKLQLQMLKNPLSHTEWQDYCTFIKTHPNIQ